jgi:hypothetical protein
MLKKYNSNTKILNKVSKKINFNNLLDLASITGSLENVVKPTKVQNTKTKTLLKTNTEININNVPNFESITGSLENVTKPTQDIQSKVKENTNLTKIISTKSIINNFHTDIFNYSARYILKNVNQIEKINSTNGESVLKKLIINNVKLDYGTEEPNAENFEVFIDGLHMPGIFSVKQNSTNIEIIINEYWLIDDRIESYDIKVFGKIKELP